MRSSAVALPFLRVLLTASRPTLSLSRAPSLSSAALSFPRHSPPPLSAPLSTRLFSRIRVSAMSTTTDGSGSGSDRDTSLPDDRLAVFALSATTSLKIQKGDITRWSVDGTSDAIVNAANERMLGGAGVDGAIHRAAGPELKEACYEVPQVYRGVRCPTGEARITPGFRLPASHVIHTVGPIYDEDENPEALLESAYRSSLALAKENKIQYVAFPAISCGIYGYPYDEAASVSISTIKQFTDNFKEVHFVLFSDDIYDAWLEKAEEIVGEEESEKIVGEESSKAIDGEQDSEMKVAEEGSGKIAGEDGSEKIAGEEGSEMMATEEGSEKIAGEGSEKIAGQDELEKSAREEGSEMIATEEGSEKIATEEGSEKIAGEAGSVKIAGEERSENIAGEGGSKMVVEKEGQSP